MGVRSLRVINQDRVQPGDGVAVAGESAISLQAVVPSDVLFFDLA
jgi:Quercetinase C-terminal cupin domain